MNDPVNNPKHYNKNGIQVIDVIETYAKSDFRLANVLKYVCRCEYKGNKLEDLKKAAWYLDRVIEELAHEKYDEYVTEGFEALKKKEELYVQTSKDRIPGDDAASQRLKRDYYKWDPMEAIASCRNPACRELIKSSDTAFRDGLGRYYCSLVCQQMVDQCGY